MNSLIEEYLNYISKVRNLRLNTLRKHKAICKQWIAYLGEKDRTLTQVCPEDILSWIEYREAAGTKDVTISGDLCIFRTLYEYLYHFGKMDHNPAKALPELICRPPAEADYLTVDECFRLLDSFDKNTLIGFRNYTIVALLWSTGIRNNEMCNLNWSDVNLSDAILLVKDGKGGAQRQIFINDRLIEDLRRYKKKFGSEGNSPVFFAFSINAPGAQRHKRLSTHRVVDILRDHAKAVGIKKPVNPRTFRHTFATHMYEAGVSIEDLKEIMGHTDKTETTIYIHVTIEAAKRLLSDHIANRKRGAL